MVARNASNTIMLAMIAAFFFIMFALTSCYPPDSSSSNRSTSENTIGGIRRMSGTMTRFETLGYEKFDPGGDAPFVMFVVVKDNATNDEYVLVRTGGETKAVFKSSQNVNVSGFDSPAPINTRPIKEDWPY